MCGINGFNFKNEGLIQAMNSGLAHRGPDGQSFYVDEDVSLGHTRLSIIDLSDAGTQPMEYTKDGHKICIVFNGEIYNYIELKSILVQKGYQFTSHSDTEVILAAYFEWGQDCINRFNGMWSFCLYDFKKQIFFCSRDRLGVKPFYYYCDNKNFIFSSELKSIVKHDYLKITDPANLNNNAVEFFFSLGYIPAPFTIYKNVSKLKAGHNLIFDLKTSSITKISSYYNAPVKSDNTNKKELLEEGKYLLTNSVGIRMRSDVPVGAFLSGGLDSSAVVGEMRQFCDINNLHTFSIGFAEKKYDESEYINIVKDHFGTQHHHHIYNENDFNLMWSKYADIFDEPFGDYSGFPSYKVCKMAREHVIVALSGDGGDEIFGGYPIYNAGFILDKVKMLPRPVIKLLYKASSFVRNVNPKLFKVNELVKMALQDRKNFHINMFSDSRYKPDIYNEWTSDKMAEALYLAKNDLSEALRIYDLLNNTLADNYLVKVDRSSMANSIEVRSPFLDYRFIAYAQKIPASMKVNMRNNKILMRELIRNVVPEHIVNRNKMGFTPPISVWLYNSISSNDFEIYKGYLKNINPNLYTFYQKLIFKNNNDNMHHFYMIKLAIFGKWYERWILSKSGAKL